MLKLKRRCIVAGEDGRRHEFRVVTTLGDGTLLLLPAKRADEIRLMTSASLSVEVLRLIRDYVVALDPVTGLFLTAEELRGRLERGANPLIRFVALSA